MDRDTFHVDNKYQLIPNLFHCPSKHVGDHCSVPFSPQACCCAVQPFVEGSLAGILLGADEACDSGRDLLLKRKQRHKQRHLETVKTGLA